MTEKEKVEALLAQLEWIKNNNRTEVQRLQAEIRRLGEAMSIFAVTLAFIAVAIAIYN